MAKYLVNPPLYEDIIIDGVKYRTCDDCKQNKPLDVKHFRKLHRVGKMKPEYPAYFSRTCLKCFFNLETEQGRARYAKTLVDNARVRARRDGLPCTIKVSDVVIPERCPLLDVKLEIGTRHNHEKSPTIDKIIPELGYVPSNIQVISHKANIIKGRGNVSRVLELRQMADRIEKTLQTRHLAVQSPKESEWKPKKSV